MGGFYVFLAAGLAVILAAISALFSAVQTAMFTIQPAELSDIRSSNPKVAGALEKIMVEPRRLMSGLLVADMLANIPLIVLCIYFVGELRHAYLVPAWLLAVLLFTLIVVVCDLVPKAIGLAHPLLIARLTSTPVGWALLVLEPISQRLEEIADSIAAKLIPASFKPRRSLEEGELQTLVRLGEEEGTLGRDESAMIQEILKLGDKTAKDCMTPRVDCQFLPDDLSQQEVVQRLKRIRYRRVPVIGDSPDDILGILDASEFLADPSSPYMERLLPPSFVPETMRALDLLRAFLRLRQGMAIVLDEFGGVEGLVTMSDIVEEILADVAPLGRGESSLYIDRLEDGRVIATGQARLDDLEEVFGVELEEEGLDTAGGLVFNLLGHQAAPGEEVVHNGLRFRVRRVGRKRIEELLIEALPATPQEETIGRSGGEES
jgi:putative hemolysin